MKKLVLRTVSLLTLFALFIVAVPVVLLSRVPEYVDSVGNTSDDQKIQGMFLLSESAKRSDNVIIYGSSELRTDYISTHPSNFFKGKRCGFQVNLVGRGSCQGIIHAMSIAASGNNLKNSKVVLITSPQSYVSEGITPDMFFANFSKQQYISIIYDETVSKNIKKRLSKRVAEMISRYDNQFGKLQGYDDIRILASAGSGEGFYNTITKATLSPYFMLEKYLCNNKDIVSSSRLLRSTQPDEPSALSSDINWQLEEIEAENVAEKEADNNEFKMRNADYKKNVGSKLSTFKDKDKDLSYDSSVEYDDLRLLLDVCKEKGIEPLFVSVPLHGQWSDYTGFSADRRKSYYEKVSSVVNEFGFPLLDLSEYENEEYFLCDTMHLGWKGWLKVDEAIIEFYNGNYREGL